MPNVIVVASSGVHDLDITIDEDDAFETLQLQILSVTEIPTGDQLLIANGPNGLITSATVAAIRDGSNIALIDRKTRADQQSLARSYRVKSGSAQLTSLLQSCTHSVFPFQELQQPKFTLLSDGRVANLCVACAQSCRQGSSTLSPPLPGEGALPSDPFACGCPELGACIFEAAAGANMPEGDRKANQLRTLLECSARELSLSQGVHALAATGGAEGQQMAQRLAGLEATVDAYRKPGAFEAVFREVPVATLMRRTLDAAAGAPESSFSDRLLRVLTAWFKSDFFTWVNAPACGGCGRGDHMDAVGRSGPATEDERRGQAHNVEIYRCRLCSAQTRLPRYNDPVRLLAWRKGRCGEWANCFTLICLALGFDARYVCDWADHVWTEVYSVDAGRYVHVDPCENAVDQPLLYESGWGKAVGPWIVAVGPDAMVDVTKRYTRKWATGELPGRRASVSEAWLERLVRAMDARQRVKPRDGPQLAGTVDEADTSLLIDPGLSVPGVEAAYCTSSARAALLAQRLAAEQEELQATLAPAALLREERQELGGRTTGSVEWRAARGELGAGGVEAAVQLEAQAATTGEGGAGSVAACGPRAAEEAVSCGPTMSPPDATPQPAAAVPQPAAIMPAADTPSPRLRGSVQQQPCVPVPAPPSAVADSPEAIRKAAQAALQARTARLFKQLTILPAEGAPACTHPHCARNPAVGVMPASKAGLKALQLAMTGDDAAAVLCSCSQGLA